MPVSYTIAPSIIDVVLEGTVTDSEMVRAQQDMFNDPDFVSSYPRLIHASEVTELQLSADVVSHLARSACQRGMRKAAVIASTDFVFALCRMYEGYAYEADCHVFRDRRAALEWLELNVNLHP